ncbi:MAG: carbamoyltransferase C-terminal domain-containing protein [Candidatus Jettenia sp. CY-1]|nr:MAG: carbamoyltransferase C-terminal domain-containing protein [Candidatus Jettenia sp. CY-1]
MKILGIHDGHNASVCLYEKGKILAALQEERIKRIKNWFGIPTEAIEWVLKYANVKKDNIDIVAVHSEYMPSPKTKDEMLHEYKNVGTLKYKVKKYLRHTFLKNIVVKKRKIERMKEINNLGFDKSKIRFVNHHQCHAAAAYYGYGNFDEPILILTNDGAGDDICASVNIGEKGKIRTIETIVDSESIGNLYAVITFMMGMVPLEHEYKIMGIAPYADAKGVEKVFTMLMDRFEFDKNNPLKWHRKGDVPEIFFAYPYLKKLFELERFDGVMGGIQKFTEVMLTQWVKNCIMKTDLHKVVLSGGVFMNVKANKLIMELPEIDDLFIYPSCGDETNAIGACYKMYADEVGIGDIKTLEDFYFGPRYSDYEVLNTISNYKFENCRIVFKKSEAIEKEVATLLKNGEVVARFAGREEFGARSLGNRAILADPSRTDIIKVINEMIKNRDFWMPFACSVLEEYASRYVINQKSVKASYMILTFDTTERVADIRAGIHPYDNTIRPQIVLKIHNKRYHRLISEFKDMTGIGAVLNTSFNLHGYPIVHSPKDALEVLDKSGLKYLAIENYLIWKN